MYHILLVEFPVILPGKKWYKKNRTQFLNYHNFEKVRFYTTTSGTNKYYH